MQRNLILLASLSLLPACTGGDGRPDDSDSAATGGITTSGTGDTDSGATDTGETVGSTSDSTTTGMTTASSDTEMECGEAMISPVAVPPNVVLVLDKSGSMLIEWDADNNAMTPDVTRWESLHNVVDFITSNFNDQINFGAQLFPSTDAKAVYGNDACLTNGTPEVPVAPNNGMAVMMGIPGATDTALAGGTPASAGFSAALGHLKSLDPAIERKIILVTDGAANCAGASVQEKMENFDTNLEVVVGDAFTADEVPTYVIGIDMVNYYVGCGATGPTACGECSDDQSACGNDSDCGGMATCEPVEVSNDGSPLANPFEELNKVAVAGGVARMGDEKFYNATDEIELMAALEEIVGQVINCTIPLDPPPSDKQKQYVTIDINGTEYGPGPVADCATEDGFVFPNDPVLDEITLCGQACEDFKANKGALDATYGCPPPG